MKERFLLIRLSQMLLIFLVIFGAGASLKAQTVYTQTDEGVIVINAAYFDSTRIGVQGGAITTVPKGVEDVINDDYLLMPSIASYGGSATTMDDGTYDAATDAPAAFYTVNFKQTGTYKIYTHANFASGAFWVMSDGNHARFEDWNNLGSWQYRSNITSKSDKLLTVNSTGENVFALVERKTSEKIDKLFLVESSASFDPAAFVASDDLSDLSVDGSTVDGFDAATLIYNVVLPEGTTNVSVDATAINPFADLTITNNGTIDVSSGSATATVVVNAEYGSASKTYTVNLTVQTPVYEQNAAGILVIDAAYFDSTRVGVQGGAITTVPKGAEDVINDDYLLMPSVATYGGSATTMDDGTYDAATDAPAAYYTVNFHTTGTYKIYAHANFASGAFWVMSDGNHARFEDWNNLGSWRYRSNITSKSDKLLTVSSTGEQVFALVERKTAEKIDKLFIVENSASFDPAAYVASADLYDIKVDGASVNAFDAATTTYNVTVPSGTTSVSVNAIPLNNYASVTGDGTIILVNGAGTATVQVAAEVGSSTKTYTVNITSGLSTDATLSDLKVDGITLKDYSSSDTTYSMYLNPGISSVEITATATDAAATVSGVGTFDVSSGSETANVVVTAEDGVTKKTYQIDFTVIGDPTVFAQNECNGLIVIDAAYCDNTRISALGDVITVEAKGSETDVLNDYYLEFPQVQDGIGDAAVAYTDAAAVYYTIDVADVGDYQIYVHVYFPNTNADSWHFGVDNSSSLERFETYDWQHSIYKTGAWYWDYNLKSGRVSIATPGEHTLAFYMRGQGGPRFDKIVLVKDGVSFDGSSFAASADLCDLRINGSTISGFNKNTLTYNYELPAGQSAVTITGIPVNSSAAVSITDNGIINVSSGSATATVEVTSEEGSTKTYTINVEGEPCFTPLYSDRENLVSDPEMNDISSFDGSGVIDFNETYCGFYAGKITGANTIEVDLSGKIQPDSYYRVKAKLYAQGSGRSQLGFEGTGMPTEIRQTSSLDEWEIIDWVFKTGASVGANIKMYFNNENSSGVGYIDNWELYDITDDASLKYIAGGGTLSPAFDPDITNYTLKVNVNSDILTIYAAPMVAEAKVTGTGQYDTAGTDSINIVVTSMDGLKTKTYTLHLAPNESDASLKGISASIGVLDPDFRSYRTAYELIVPKGTLSVDILAETNHPEATVEGGGTIVLSNSKAQVNLIVTAKDGVTKKSYLVYIRPENNINTSLLSLTTDIGSLEPGFDPETTSYSLSLPYGTTGVNTSAVPYDSTASIVGTGAVDLTSGSAIDTIVVTATDGSYRIYTVNITVMEETVVYTYTEPANGITIMEAEHYTSVRANPDGINWSASTSFAGYSGDGFMMAPSGISYGDATIVPAEAPAIVYKVNFTIEGPHYIFARCSYANGNSDSYWLELGEDFMRMNPYSEIGENYDTWGWNTSTTAGKAQFDIPTVGQYDVMIYQREQNFRLDKIIITTDPNIDPNTAKEINANLAALTVDTGTLSPEFNPGITNYALSVPEGTTSVNVSATPADTNSVVTGDGVIDVSSGSATATIIVTADDNETTRTYTVNIVTGEIASDNADLSALTTDVGTLSPTFDPETISYVLSITDSTITTVNVSATAADTSAIVTGDGAIDISSGSATATINVTAEDGVTTKTYTVNITVKEPSETVVYTEPSNGITIMEAELYSSLNANSDGLDWSVSTELAGFSGDGYMIAPPDISYGDASTVQSEAPAIIYRVDFTIEGPHYIFARCSYANGNSDSYWLEVGEDFMRMNPYSEIGENYDTWGWNSSTTTGDATFNIPAVGEYDVVIYQREQNFRLDKIIITTDPDFDPNAVTGGNVNLSSLTVDVGTLDPTFDPASTNYMLSVPDGTATVNVSATPADTNSVVSGDGAIDVSSGSATATILVTAEDSVTTKVYTINISVVGEITADYVQTDDGLVDIPAEGYSSYTPGSGDREGDAWTLSTDIDGYLGSGFMKVEFAEGHESMGADPNLSETSGAKLTYTVEFVKTGTHYVWAHVYYDNADGNGGAKDSWFLGLDGSIGPKLDGTWPATYDQWFWDGGSAEKATFDVASTGIHTIDLFQREDQAIIDHIYITTDPDYNPNEITGIEDQISTSMKVYPTLSKGDINIEIDRAPGNVEVFDMTGRRVLHRTLNSTRETIHVDNEGIFIVRIESEGVFKIEKIVIRK